MSEQTSTCLVRELGVTEYLPVWEAMKTFTQQRSAITVDELWVLQHHPVFTLGQVGLTEHILDSQTIPIIKTDRGGQVTYHGPGQLIVYFLLDVRRRNFGVRTLVDIIEKSVIEVLDTFDIEGSLLKGAPGVYVNDKKIAALGLRIRKGCSLHGLSLNIDMNLTPFSQINPCGYPGLQITQLREHVHKKFPSLLVETQQRLIEVLQSRLL